MTWAGGIGPVCRGLLDNAVSINTVLDEVLALHDWLAGRPVMLLVRLQ